MLIRISDLMSSMSSLCFLVNPCSDIQMKQYMPSDYPIKNSLDEMCRVDPEVWLVDDRTGKVHAKKAAGDNKFIPCWLTM